ncbi:hypothetical protein ACOMHN_018128 [Nucella lapillus]
MLCLYRRQSTPAFQATALTLFILVTSWTADVIRAKHMHDVTPGKEQELTSAAPKLGEVPSRPDAGSSDAGHTAGIPRVMSWMLSPSEVKAISHRSSPLEVRVRSRRSSVPSEVVREDLTADLSVCSRLSSGPGPLGVHLRSSCPWHYLELPTGGSPRTLLQANLTCGHTCLMMTPGGHKVPSSYPCMPVTRTLPVLHCSGGVSSSPGHHAPEGHHAEGHHGGRCCRTELRSVPVAFTCAFPSL